MQFIMSERILFLDELNEIIENFTSTMKESGKTEEEIDNFFDSEQGDNFYVTLITTMSKSLTESLEKYLEDDYKEFHSESEEYTNHLKDIWGSGFAWMHNLYLKCVDICESHSVLVNESKIASKNYHIAEALYHIHGKAMLIYAEIICLLENGYPDGAFMHYRTLHELWAVAEFINTDTDDVARAFLESAGTKSNHESSHYKWAGASNRFTDESEPITISKIVSVAHDNLKEGKSDISKKHLMKLYVFPNLLIHPSAKGVLSRTSEPYQNSVTVGRVDTGISTPAINSSMMFFNITRLHLSFAPNIVSLIGLGILNEIVGEKIVPIFQKINETQLASKD